MITAPSTLKAFLKESSKLNRLLNFISTERRHFNSTSKDNGKNTENSNSSLNSDGGKRGEISGRLMKSWELHSYGEPAKELQLNTSARVPVLKCADDVLVEVRAASLNPLDVAMCRGYGSTTFNALRSLDKIDCSNSSSLFSPLSQLFNSSSSIEFPLTLGRDFGGVVKEVGSGVEGFKKGDEVYGVCGLSKSGSHAQFTLASSKMILKKPKNLSFVEAASLPYAGLTAWSAITVSGGYFSGFLSGKKFLILGGSGGVGTFAIQYLRANEAYTVSTCAEDALGLLSQLGCNFAIDYKDREYLSHIQNHASFDAILDFSGQSSQPELLKFLKKPLGQYITLTSPFLSNIDKNGLVGGIAKNLTDLTAQNINSFQKDSAVNKWAFFIPSSYGFGVINTLVSEAKIVPVIQEVFSFDNLPQAYEKLKEGHARGKIVIDFLK